MKKLLFLVVTFIAVLSIAGCGAGTKQSSLVDPQPKETVTLKGITDLTPHSELIEFVRPQLEKEGIIIDLVATAADATTNERLETGEIDFNFHQHLPYLEEWNEINGGTLVNAGDIHVEPITAFSEKYDSLDEVPDNASIVVPNDATNEYRALSILEKAGFIELDPDLPELKASVADIKKYVKPVTIKEIDSAQIINLASDFDIYITNINKVIEAGIDTTKYLFKEDSDSPYANIIAVREEDKDNPAIKKLVEALRSDETKEFIKNTYNGAVIPAK